MIIIKGYRLAIGLIVLVSCLSGRSAEPNEPPIKLRFNVSSMPLSTSRVDKQASILPTHMARFTVKWYFVPPNDPNRSDLLKTRTGKTLSDLQKEFMKGKQAYWLFSLDHDMFHEYGMEMMGFTGVDFPKGQKSYHAYVVSKEDAFKMATALVEFLAETGTDKARPAMQQHLEGLSEKQRQLRMKIMKTKKEVAEKAKEKESAYQKYVHAVRDSLYSFNRTSDVPNELRQTMLELNKMLDVLNIEIVGIKSKISAIKKYSAQNMESHESLKLALREMAIREEIELAGAESRRQTITNIKERHKILLDLHKKVFVLEQEAGELAGGINRYENNMKMIEKELDRWDSRELLFQVENDNKVFIRPLRIK